MKRNSDRAALRFRIRNYHSGTAVRAGHGKAATLLVYGKALTAFRAIE
jgi:hypothetical protein